MKVHLVVEYVMKVLRMSRSEIGEWCGVTEGSVNKWIAMSGGQEHSGWGHAPRPENLDLLRELRREARCVDDFAIDPMRWRSLAYRFADGKPEWTPVWEQFANYKCASSPHYPQDDPVAALNDLGEVLLDDDESPMTIRIRSASLTGEADARCFGEGGDWEVLVKRDLNENRRREEGLRELQAHVFHVKPSPDGIQVEQPLKGVERQMSEENGRVMTDGPLIRREMNQRLRTWVLKRSNVAASEKRAIARYVATHILRPQWLVQIASGTTENCLMDEIITNDMEDIQVTTNNLQVLVKGLDAADLGISVNLTGGTLNPSIDSLIGPDAAKVISDDRYMPHAVFFGAAGLSFHNRLCISYAFEDEEATQVAYATRPTEKRVLMADDSKLGRTYGRRAPVSIEQMMQTAEECIVVSTYKDEAADRIENEVAALKKLLEPLASSPAFRFKNFSLRFVDMEGSVHREHSLRDLREGKW